MSLALLITDDPGLIAVGDVVRAACAIAAAAAIGLGIGLAVNTTRHTRVAREVTYDPRTALDFALLVLGFVALSGSALFTELGRLGEEVTWRLPVNVVGVSLGLYSVIRLLRRAHRAQQ